MIPLRDNIRHSRFPLITFIVIALNVLVFAVQSYLDYSKPWREEIMIQAGASIPAAMFDDRVYEHAWEELEGRVLDDLDHRYEQKTFLFMPYRDNRNWRAYEPEVRKDFAWAKEHLPNLGLLSLITSMFLHGSIWHILGNMWFLWLFGNNVEDRIGRPRFIVFYLLCGFVAGFTNYYLSQDSIIPTIGASGAIGGVLGAYIILFPTARVLTLIPIFILIFLREIPAWVFLGIWFLYEWFGATSLFFEENRAVGGIAHWAHVGGFLAGFFLIRFFLLGRNNRSTVRYSIR